MSVNHMLTSQLWHNQATQSHMQGVCSCPCQRPGCIHLRAATLRPCNRQVPVQTIVRLVQVLVMQTALAGVGPTCRAFFWCSDPSVQRKPLPQELMHSFRDRMCDCMDVSPTAPIQVRPSAHPRMVPSALLHGSFKGGALERSALYRCSSKRAFWGALCCSIKQLNLAKLSSAEMHPSEAMKGLLHSCKLFCCCISL